jgi:peptide/nickel transport system permease protein
MTNEGRTFLRTAPRLVTAPGLTIMLTVVMINMLGDALRDHFGSASGSE